MVEIWGGYIDAEKSAPWENNTVTDIISTTKTIVALVALLLVVRRVLDVKYRNIGQMLQPTVSRI